jgi:transposase-like protein
MPQIQFPFFPEGVTHITSLLAFAKRDGRVTYFNGNMPVFIHDEADVASFRMITAQFVVSGHAKQAQIARAFGVAKISVKRAVKRYREQGPKGFYAPKKTRGAAVLTAGVLDQAQRLLDEGVPTADVADQLGVKRDTLAKAVRAGRLHARAKPEGGTAALLITTSKSERTSRDSEAPMGMGAINVPARLAASVGALEAVAPQFVPALDVPYGGVLFALPALLALGLVDSTPGFLELPKGYYGLDSLMILLAFMALARLNAMEQLRYCAPGEWGKLLGLDRAPEVRTLRAKVRLLGEQGKAEPWSAALSERWMQAAPEQAGTLYVDGHVRVYNGDQTELPRPTTRASGFACAPPPTTGSTPWMASPSSWSIRPSTRASSTSWSSTSCLAWSAKSPASRMPQRSPHSPCCIVSRSCLTAKVTRHNCSNA